MNDCRSKWKKWADVNRERVRVKDKEWHSKNADSVKAYRRKYYAENRDRLIRARREYCAKNREKIREDQRRRWAENAHVRAKVKERNKLPENRFREYKWRAKKKNLRFSLSFRMFKALLELPCYYCGRKLSLMSIDRVNSDKGYIRSNVVTSCVRCNGAKSDLTVDEFLEMCREVVSHYGNNAGSQS